MSPLAASLLSCQRDPQARTGQSTVLSCTAREDGRYDLLLDDSVLYPEGGGQPPDHGTVAGVAVVDTQKAPGGVACVALGAVAPGPAEVVVDWARRFDHMQQHTAQHLVTAVAQDRLSLATVGFHLGEDVSTIDLDGPLSDEDRARLQAWVDAEVRADRAVTHRAVSVEEYGALDVRSRGLPDGHEGAVRLVGIEGLDLNTCGGTHVARLSQLQLVHLGRTERHKGGSRLHFIAGGRALAALDEARDRTQALSEALTCGPAEHVDAVHRLLDGAKAGARREKALLGELAELLGATLARDPAAVRALHRDEADMALLTRIAAVAQAADPDGRYVLTGGGSVGGGEGVFLVVGPEAWVAEAGARLAEAVGGRGGGRGGRFQGKGRDMAARPGWT
ncbi:MAG: alanyl-tRNA editing protein [Alphaproteobacteria bacterium]|nr:alanyl-tRNA editing protein [Alphaproteobacteria bacterium]